jgi:hypothetical protein
LKRAGADIPEAKGLLLCHCFVDAEAVADEECMCFSLGSLCFSLGSLKFGLSLTI